MTERKVNPHAFAAVRKGMALLDEQRPGWRDVIDPLRLNLKSCFECVLGQLFADEYIAGGQETEVDFPTPFSLGVERLGLNSGWDSGSHRSMSHGFDTLPMVDYDDLQYAWETLMREG